MIVNVCSLFHPIVARGISGCATKNQAACQEPKALRFRARSPKMFFGLSVVRSIGPPLGTPPGRDETRRQSEKGQQNDCHYRLLRVQRHRPKAVRQDRENHLTQTTKLRKPRSKPSTYETPSLGNAAGLCGCTHRQSTKSRRSMEVFEADTSR